MDSLQRRTAFDNCFVEQAFGGRHRQQCADLQTAAGLAENRHIAGISAEVNDIVAYPFKCSHDVQQSCVARIGILLAAYIRQIQISKNIEPVIHADHHHIPGTGQVGAVKSVCRARARGKTAAVEPNHDRPLASVIHTGRENIDDQAILSFHRWLSMVQYKRIDRAAELWRGRSVLECFAHTRPRLWLARRHEPVAPRRRGTVSNSSEDVRPTLDDASNLSRGTFHYGPFASC